MPDWLARIDKNWTLFLDRDGTLNQRLIDAYVTSPGQWIWMEGVPEALALAAARFGKIIIVTNQQGIAKGLMSEKQLDEVHRHMLKEIAEKGGRIDAIYFCPDLRARADNCRKPRPDMGIQAQFDFPEIDFKRSVMVGDMETDIQFGKNLGMKTVLLGTENLPADIRTESLVRFMDMIEQAHGS